jgi:hypothetical protein
MSIRRNFGAAAAAVAASVALTGTAAADRGGQPNENANPNAQGAPAQPAQPPGNGGNSQSAPNNNPRSNSAPGHTGQTPQGPPPNTPPANPGNGNPGGGNGNPGNGNPGNGNPGNGNPGGGNDNGNNGNDEVARRRITICHRTGSATNPYVEITISEAGLNGHDGHGDIIPAPAGGCPDEVQGGGGSGPGSTGGGGGGDPQGTQGPVGVLGEVAEGTGPVPPLTQLAANGGANGEVLGASADAPGAETANAAASPQGRQNLPFTGLEALLVALIGSLALGAGLALYRMTSPTR